MQQAKEERAKRIAELEKTKEGLLLVQEEKRLKVEAKKRRQEEEARLLREIMDILELCDFVKRL